MVILHCIHKCVGECDSDAVIVRMRRMMCVTAFDSCTLMSLVFSSFLFLPLPASSFLFLFLSLPSSPSSPVFLLLTPPSVFFIHHPSSQLSSQSSLGPSLYPHSARHSKSTPAYSVFSPESVALNFVDPLVSAGIHVGFIAYLNPKVGIYIVHCTRVRWMRGIRGVGGGGRLGLLEP